jgi:hypothetical protein
MKRRLRELLAFVEQNRKIAEASNTVVLTGPVCPTLFLSLFIGVCKREYSIPIVSINCSQGALDRFFHEMHMSFLGTEQTFWLKGLESLNQEDYKLLWDFLCSYRGPHTVICFAHDITSLDNSSVVSIVECSNLEQQEYMTVCAFFNSSPSLINHDFSDLLFERAATVSVEEACLLMYYQALLGKQQHDFFNNWFDKIIASKRSLFVLSRYFFAKDAREFFRELKRISSEYPLEFWVSYWAEQLWQAVAYMQSNKSTSHEKRNTNYRLPYSFLQRDWKLSTQRELVAAHSFLYELDYAVKHGCKNQDLDLFYAKFLFGKFAH